MLHLTIPRILTLIALSLSLFLFSCKTSSKKETEPIPTFDWSVYKTASTDVATIENGYAYLSTNYSSGIPPTYTLIQSHNKLKGDFELTISYSDCYPDGGLFDTDKKV